MYCIGFTFKCDYAFDMLDPVLLVGYLVLVSYTRPRKHNYSAVILIVFK